jgi:bifunctional polynucleotide phosphatase/kinase
VLALTDYERGLEVPDRDEGFREVKRVSFVFEGTEEEKRRWSMWWQLGKVRV